MDRSAGYTVGEEPGSNVPRRGKQESNGVDGWGPVCMATPACSVHMLRIETLWTRKTH